MKFDHAANHFERRNEPSLDPILDYWNHLFGASEGIDSLFADEPKGFLHIFSGLRPPGEEGKVNKKRLEQIREKHFR